MPEIRCCQLGLYIPLWEFAKFFRQEESSIQTNKQMGYSHTMLLTRKLVIIIQIGPFLAVIRQLLRNLTLGITEGHAGDAKMRPVNVIQESYPMKHLGRLQSKEIIKLLNNNKNNIFFSNSVLYKISKTWYRKSQQNIQKTIQIVS